MKIAMPHSINLEECLLGCMLNKQEYAETATELSKELFYDPKNQEFFEIISDLVEKEKSVNCHLILEEKKRRTGKISTNDATYLADIFNKTALCSDYDEYLSELKDLDERRSSIKICWEILPKLEKGSEETEEIIDKAIQSFSGVDRSKRSMRSVGEIIQEERVLENIKESHEYYQKHGHKKLSEKTIATKFYGIDTLLGGLLPSRLYILGARPGIGKTALVLNISMASAEENHPVALFSLEMGERELVDRYVASSSKKNLVDIQMGSLATEDLPTVESVCERLEVLPIFIDPKSFSMPRIRSEIRRQKRENHIKLVIIDYLQLIAPRNPAKGGNRNLDISEISRELKLISKEFDVAVFCLSQLSRTSEREKRSPMLSDLRDSGAIEQDADVVMLMERNGKWGRFLLSSMDPQ